MAYTSKIRKQVQNILRKKIKTDYFIFISGLGEAIAIFPRVTYVVS